MGSKKLKAVVARGDQKVPIADIEAANNLRKEHIAELRKGPIFRELNTYGTCVHTDSSAHNGDTPVKNWGGIGVIDLPDVSGFHKDEIKAKVESKTGCWHCPVVCRGRLKEQANMADVIAALKHKIPALEGPAIRTGEERLVERYKFNVNGRFYYDSMDFNPATIPS